MVVPADPHGDLDFHARTGPLGSAVDQLLLERGVDGPGQGVVGTVRDLMGTHPKVLQRWVEYAEPASVPSRKLKCVKMCGPPRGSWPAERRVHLGPRLVQDGRSDDFRLVKRTFSEPCVGPRLDRTPRSFPQSSAEIGSDRQVTTAFCEVADVRLRIRAGQS